MKKQTGVIVALVVTLLTIGTAFAIQHYASANQSVSEQVAETSSQRSSTSSMQSSRASSSSKSEHHTKKAASSTSSRKTTRAKREPRQAATKQSKVTRHRQAQKKQTTTHKTTVAAKARKTTSVKKAVTTKPSTTTAETVHLTVSGYKKTFFNGKVEITDKSTVFSVLQSSKLKIKYMNGVAVYVSSINGLAENDIKVGSGWKYRVNGKFIDKGANKEPVSKGDSVHWYFTTAGY